MSATVPYLGLPTAMRALPLPTGSGGQPDVAAPSSRGDVALGLMSGGVTVLSRVDAKQQFTLPYSTMVPSDARVIIGFYQRLYGLGPFAYVDPTVTNVLGFDVASCGARLFASHHWQASAGVLTAAAPGSGSPQLAADSGVLTWSSLTASATLMPGTAANVADPAKAPVWVAAEFATCSLWVKASATTTLSLQLCGFDVTGVTPTTTLAVTATVGTGWQRLTVTAAPNEPSFTAATVAYVVPRLVLGGTVPATVSIAAAQVEYGSAASAWDIGYGCPRVLPIAPPGRDINTIGFQDHTLVLAEV